MSAGRVRRQSSSCRVAWQREGEGLLEIPCSKNPLFNAVMCPRRLGLKAASVTFVRRQTKRCLHACQHRYSREPRREPPTAGTTALTCYATASVLADLQRFDLVCGILPKRKSWWAQQLSRSSYPRRVGSTKSKAAAAPSRRIDPAALQQHTEQTSAAQARMKQHSGRDTLLALPLKRRANWSAREASSWTIVSSPKLFQVCMEVWNP
jgi:hypothetical protein